MKKDILLLSQYFYPQYITSANLTYDTACYLADSGLTVDALVGYPDACNLTGKVPVRETIHGIGVRRIKYMEFRRASFVGRLVNYFSFVGGAFLRLAAMRKYRCILVYTDPPVLPVVPLLAKKLFGTKFVLVAYDVYPEIAYASGHIRPGGRMDRAVRMLNHQLYREADGVIALSDDMRDFLLANRPELSADRVHVISNWAHEEKLAAKPDYYTHFGYREDQFIVSYFGNMGICQDMDTLLDAAEKLQDTEQIQFLLVGHGNKKENLETRVERQGLKHVKILDYLTGDEFKQAVAISSCCVVSLEKGLKGTCAPSKYYSYLQGGQPIVAVMEAGSYLEREICEQAIGCSAENGNGAQLAEALRQLAKDPKACREMGERAHRLYETRYAREICLPRYRKILEEILSR